MVVKKDADFKNMKNLFLANCLKLNNGEEGFSKRVEKVMSNRIRANRNELLAPIDRKATKK